MKTTKYILIIIVFSQFCCTSLWFAGNGIIQDLISNFNLELSALGHLTSAVQFGFIIGTFLFALMTISDRFSPSKVFFLSALLAAIFNMMTVFEWNALLSLICFRFLVGFFLAGIYPVGMKIASDYYQEGLGKSLGLLVGALVIGTGFPHLLKGFHSAVPWEYVIYITSGLSFLGGLLMLVLVPNGPYRKALDIIDFSTVFKLFKKKAFRVAAFGYFGHMWELYAFWAFVPLLLSTYLEFHPSTQFSVPLVSFIVIALGSLACVLAGYLSQFLSIKKVATSALALSGLCCLFSPLFFSIDSHIIFILILILWGMFVIADSPLFSTLVAQNTNANTKGTALTIVNSIGFAITIISIQIINFLIPIMEIRYLFVILAIGPLFGLFYLLKK